MAPVLYYAILGPEKFIEKIPAGDDRLQSTAGFIIRGLGTSLGMSLRRALVPLGGLVVAQLLTHHCVAST